jgi:hypothetical protein
MAGGAVLEAVPMTAPASPEPRPPSRAVYFPVRPEEETTIGPATRPLTSEVRRRLWRSAITGGFMLLGGPGAALVLARGQGWAVLLALLPLSVMVLGLRVLWQALRSVRTYHLGALVPAVARVQDSVELRFWPQGEPLPEGAAQGQAEERTGLGPVIASFQWEGVEHFVGDTLEPGELPAAVRFDGALQPAVLVGQSPKQALLLVTHRIAAAHRRLR